MDGGVRTFGWVGALIAACAWGAPASGDEPIPTESATIVADQGGVSIEDAPEPEPAPQAGTALPEVLRIDGSKAGEAPAPKEEAKPGVREHPAGEPGGTDQGVGEEGKRGSAGEGDDVVPTPTTGRAVTACEDLPLGVVREEGGTGFGARTTSPMGGLGLLRTLGAVCVVVLLIVVARVLIARTSRAGGGGIRSQLGPAGHAPSGILQILGRYPVARGQTLVLLKLDRRVLLLSQTSTGFSTLSEITEADDVASILSKSRDDEGESLSARFGALLRRLERDPAMAGGDDVEIAPYLRRPSLDEVDGFDDAFTDARGAEPATDPDIDTQDPGEALRRRLEGLRGLSA